MKLPVQKTGRMGPGLVPDVNLSMMYTPIAGPMWCYREKGKWKEKVNTIIQLAQWRKLGSTFTYLHHKQNVYCF